jgi:hypothetical protein
VGRSIDRSTAAFGGRCLFFSGRLLGVQQFVELPLELFGSQLANALAVIDQIYNLNVWLSPVELSSPPSPRGSYTPQIAVTPALTRSI